MNKKVLLGVLIGSSVIMLLVLFFPLILSPVKKVTNSVLDSTSQVVSPEKYESLVSSLDKDQSFISTRIPAIEKNVVRISAVSTGQIYEKSLQDINGKDLGKALVLKTVTVDYSGRVLPLDVVLTFAPSSNPEYKDILFNIKYNAAKSKLKTSAITADFLSSQENLSLMFDEGSVWHFYPYVWPDYKVSEFFTSMYGLSDFASSYVPKAAVENNNFELVDLSDISQHNPLLIFGLDIGANDEI